MKNVEYVLRSINDKHVTLSATMLNEASKSQSLSSIVITFISLKAVTVERLGASAITANRGERPTARATKSCGDVKE